MSETRKANRAKGDKGDLFDALMRLYYHSVIPDPPALEHLKKSHHITAKGQVSPKGKDMIDAWFARGADRIKLMKDLTG